MLRGLQMGCIGYRKAAAVSILLAVSLFPALISEGDLQPLRTRDLIDGFGGGVSDGLPFTGDYNCVGVGDIDKDGYQDIVIGAEENYGTLGTVGLHAFFGSGDGNWTQQTISPSGSYAAIEIRDVDNDGSMEVFAGYQENTDGIGAWEWNGTQFRSSGISSPVTSGNVNYIRTENISGPSGYDMAVASSNGVKYFQGSGTSPISWTEYSTGLTNRGLCTSMDVSDLNNDGLLDIVVGQYGDGLLIFTQNGGTTTWTDASDTLPSVENSGRIMGLVSGDVNNDGNNDIIYCRRTSPTGLFLLLGNGGGAEGDDLRWTYLNNSWTSRPGGTFYQMHLDDVDKDGDLDLLAAKEDHGLHLYLGNGSEEPGGYFGWTEVIDLGLPDDMMFYGSNFIDFDNDGDLDVSGCTWGNGARIYQNNITQPEEPVARAGKDITIFLGNTTVLDGTNSSDAQDCPDGDDDGSVLIYDWNLTDQPPGSLMTENDLQPSDGVPRPAFTPTHPGNYSLTLSVIDTEGHRSRREDAVRISVILLNTAPIANAGQDRNVFSGDIVVLNGSLSYDKEDSIEQLVFYWEPSVSNPESVTITSSLSPFPHFTAPDTIGTYGFSLMVEDSLGLLSYPDEVNISVFTRPNIRPIADAGEDRDAIANTTLTLDGTGSFDPDGEIVSWIWTSISHPLLDLIDQNSSSPEFIPVTSGKYRFSLRVIDDRGGISDQDEVNISVGPDNYPPVANAGKNRTVNLNMKTYLNGSLSFDPDGIISFWDWRSTTHTDIALNNANSSGPDFIPAETGEHIFTLRIMDEKGLWSEPDQVKITVVEEDVNITDPVENIPPTIEIISPKGVEALNGSVEIIWEASDGDGDPLTFILDLIHVSDQTIERLFEGPMPAEMRMNLNTYLFGDGAYDLRITVDDGWDPATAVTSILIKNREDPPINTTDDDGDDDEEPSGTGDGGPDDPGGPDIWILFAVLFITLIILLILFAGARKIHVMRSEGDRDGFFEE